MLLRFIAAVYFLLFICGLVFSLYFLSQTLALIPIPMMRMLQYILLSILFSILLVNTLRAFSLKAEDVLRLKTSTNNFKWLFLIAAVLATAGWFGLFNSAGKEPAHISVLQIALLITLCGFCFWSNDYLDKERDEKK
jgi:hypothetical protein